MKPTAGEVLFEGRDIFALKGDSLKAFRKSVQIIFQDPFASLNPRRTVFDTISEPLKIHRIVDKKYFKDAKRRTPEESWSRSRCDEPLSSRVQRRPEAEDMHCKGALL